MSGSGGSAEPDGERGALLALALHGDGGAVGVQDSSDDREAQARSTMPAGCRGVRLVESVEDLRESGGMDPDARILHGDFHEIAVQVKWLSSRLVN